MQCVRVEPSQALDQVDWGPFRVKVTMSAVNAVCVLLVGMPAATVHDEKRTAAQRTTAEMTFFTQDSQDPRWELYGMPWSRGGGGGSRGTKATM